MLFRRLILIISYLFLFLFPLFAKGKFGHGNDILNVLYGYADESVLETIGSEKEKQAYYIVRDAVAFAIDEQGMGREQTINDYNRLKERIGKTSVGASVKLPDYSEFPSLGGGLHRAYNHQGFYYRYEDDKYLERWELGRDRILIPSVSAAFDIPLGDYRAEAMAIILYYIHMVGDLYEGTDRSVNQLGPIKNNYYLLSKLQSDEELILKNNYGKPRNIFMDEPMYNSFQRIKRSVSHARSRKSAFDFTMEFFRRELNPFIVSLLNNN